MAPKTIFLIEDDNTMRSLLETLFQLEGYNTYAIEPTSIDDALRLVRKHRPEALLIDVHLKRFSGIDLASAIRNENTIDQPIIIMASGVNLQNECISSGADQFYLKPYMPQQMIDWLKSKLDC
jgi:CheY-like chemotaxis protein